MLAFLCGISVFFPLHSFLSKPVFSKTILEAVEKELTKCSRFTLMSSFYRLNSTQRRLHKPWLLCDGRLGLLVLLVDLWPLHSAAHFQWNHHCFLGGGSQTFFLMTHYFNLLFLLLEESFLFSMSFLRLVFILQQSFLHIVQVLGFKNIIFQRLKAISAQTGLAGLVV